MSRHTLFPVRRVVALLSAAIALAACSGPILANAPAARPSPPRPTPGAAGSVDPRPLAFPRDDGPHDRLTEWWYDTGHLDAADGRRFGYEFVVFRAERGDFPVSWASHLAVTDEAGRRFAYAQRSEVGPQVDRSPRGPDGTPTGFDLAVQPATVAPPAAASSAAASPASGPTASAASTAAASPTIPPDPSAASGAFLAGTPSGGSPWTMVGAGGRDTLTASLTDAEAAAAGLPGGLGLDLRLVSTRPPVLHDTIGWIDFRPAGSSYYYSRTRLATSGTIVLDGETIPVSGISWFDHQWGDFIAVGGAGWDWFAVNLADGSDLTVSLVRAADGSHPLVYGTLVAAEGTVRHLARADFSVDVTGRWTSPRTGTTYPAGWTIRVPGEALSIDLSPTVADQELDTRPTSGVVYWEGSQEVTASRGGVPLSGRAYVELTGYLGAGSGTP